MRKQLNQIPIILLLLYLGGIVNLLCLKSEAHEMSKNLSGSGSLVSMDIVNNKSDQINLDKGMSGVDENLYDSIQRLLQKKNMKGNFYIGSVNKESGWALISLSKVLKSEYTKSKEHDGSFLAEDFILIANTEDKGKTWKVVFEKDREFNNLVKNAPDKLLSKQAKELFIEDSGIKAKAVVSATVSYKFPWQELNLKEYSKGWHGTQTPGMDFRSTATERRILSSAAGTITNVSICKYSVNVTIHHADGKIFKYLHLNKDEFDSNKIKNGMSIPQGRKLGLLRKGDFSDDCGYAVQTSKTHHLHWGLPTNGTVTIDQWSIKYSNTCWSKSGYSNRCVGSSFGSTNKEV